MNKINKHILSHDIMEFNNDICYIQTSAISEKVFDIVLSLQCDIFTVICVIYRIIFLNEYAIYFI